MNFEYQYEYEYERERERERERESRYVWWLYIVATTRVIGAWGGGGECLDWSPLHCAGSDRAPVYIQHAP